MAKRNDSKPRLVKKMMCEPAKYVGKKVNPNIWFITDKRYQIDDTTGRLIDTQAAPVATEPTPAELVLKSLKENGSTWLFSTIRQNTGLEMGQVLPALVELMDAGTVYTVEHNDITFWAATE